MPQAKRTHTTPIPAPAAPGSSRRRLFAGLSATLLTGAAIATAARGAPVAARVAPDDDTELLALCAVFHRLHALANAPGDEAAWGAALDERWSVSDEIRDLPARTIDGHRAKASVGLVLLRENNGSDDFTSGDKAFAFAALRDLAGEVNTAAPPSMANVDAELIHLHARLVLQGEVVKRMEAAGSGMSGGITPESEAFEQELSDADDAWFAIAERMCTIPALTPAGLRAKAEAMQLAIQRTVCTRIGDTLATIETGEEGYTEHRLALSLARNVLALGGVA